MWPGSCPLKANCPGMATFVSCSGRALRPTGDCLPTSLGPQGAARPVRAAWLLKYPPPNCREEISALGRASECAGPAYGSPMEVEQARSAMRWYDRPSLTSAGNMGAQRALVVTIYRTEQNRTDTVIRNQMGAQVGCLPPLGDGRPTTETASLISRSSQ
jgi:hypothetical protein